MPSLAPGSLTLLMSRANRRTYGAKAVKYTTLKTEMVKTSKKITWKSRRKYAT